MNDPIKRDDAVTVTLNLEEIAEARTLIGQGRPVDKVAEWLGVSEDEIRAVVPPRPHRERTGRGLRDVLFDEIESLQRGDSAPQRAVAVAGLAREIVNNAKAEVEFLKGAGRKAEPWTETVQLGSPISSAPAVAAITQDN